MHNEKAHSEGIFSFQTNLIEINNDITIFCNSEASDYANLCFTIDTGAMSSIIKYGAIRKGTMVTRNNTIFHGLVKNHTVKSIAKLRTHLLIEGVAIEHTFYVVPNDINLKNDGIIGTDFLRANRAKINYYSKTIKFHFPMRAKIRRGEKSTETSQLPVIRETKETILNQMKLESKNNIKENSREPQHPICKEPEKTSTTEMEPSKGIHPNNKIDYHTIRENQPNNQDHKLTQRNEKTTKKVKNPDFYKDLPLNYFDSYPTLRLHPIGYDYKPFTHKIMRQKEIPESLNKINPNKKEFQTLKPIFENSILQITNCIDYDQQEIINYEDRLNYLINNIDLNHCTSLQKDELIKCFAQHSKAFQLPGDKFEHTNASTHKIDLKPGSNPISIRQYRTPEHHKKELKRQLEELEEKGIISKCDSPWNSPAFLVPKKDGKDGKKQFRLVIDYKALNRVIQPTAYPIPLIDEIIDQMRNSTLFTTLDLYGAFHQVPLEEKSKQYTAFSTSYEKYCFNSAPFGLVSSPYAWLKTIHKVLYGLIGHNVFVYMDDIIIFSPDLNTHIQTLNRVLEKLTESKLKLKLDKSKFLKERVHYLGYIISSEGLMADPKKTEAIDRFPIPKNVKEVQTFLGMCNYYRRYIPNYADIAKPLYELCKKNMPFSWSKKCIQSFDQFKKLLTSPPILIYPSFDIEFILHTDSSDLAIAAVLSQGEMPYDKPIQYFSKTLNPAQTRYSTIEKELLAIILSVENFRHYLIGQEFTIVTDHRPLVYLFSAKDINARLHRWKYALMGYQFKIIHKSGCKNVVADALSRIQIQNDDNNEPYRFPLNILMTKQSEPSHLLALTRAQRQRNQHSETLPIANTNEGGKNTSNNSETRIHDEIPNDTTQEDTDTTPPLNKNNKINESVTRTSRFYLTEKPSFLAHSTEFDHIFFIFNKINGELQKKLQHKLKTKFKFAENNKIQSIDRNRTILLMPLTTNTEENKTQMLSTIDRIYNMSIINHYNKIAINLELNNYKAYFEFKILLKNTLEPESICPTLYLNKIIEVNDVKTIDEILKTYHQSIFGGHPGFERMKCSIQKIYHWPGMTKDIKEFIKNCSTCELSKITVHTKNPMVITTSASEPFQKIYIDIVGPINPVSIHENRYIFTCNCSLTKFAIAVPMPDTTALSTAKALVHHVFMKYGISEEIVSDNGSNFISDLLKQVNKLFQVKQTLLTPYRPQSNQVEKYHKSLGNYLKAFVQKERDQWCEYLDFATFAYNNTHNQATGYAPFELVFGRSSKLPHQIKTRKIPIYNYENYANELRLKLKESHEYARDNLLRMKETNKKYYDRHRSKTNLHLKVNDLVLLLKAVKTFKFENPYEGPYRVEKIISPTVVLIKKKNKSLKINTDRLKPATANYGKDTPPPVNSPTAITNDENG